MKEFRFDINPVPASRPRVSRYGTYYLPTYRKFKAEMQQIVNNDRGSFSKTKGPLAVTVVCRVRKPKTTELLHPRGDVDNYAKAVLDSLNDVLWDDDDQIVQLTCFKEFCKDDQNPQIFVEVEPVKIRKTRKVRKLCSKRTRLKR